MVTFTLNMSPHYVPNNINSIISYIIKLVMWMHFSFLYFFKLQSIFIKAHNKTQAIFRVSRIKRKVSKGHLEIKTYIKKGNHECPACPHYFLLYNIAIV